ncbi:MAG: hypothetical protein ACYCQI_08500 [Gammaproteobacteria bacterium]
MLSGNFFVKNVEVKKQEKKEELINLRFLPDVLEIIQGYICDDKPVPYSSISFWGDKGHIAAHLAAYYALWGFPEQFEEIIRQCPEALLSRVERVGPNTSVRGTLYQLLLWVDDDHIRNEKGETFVEMARRILINKYGEKIEAKQKTEWFGGWDEETHLKELKAEFDKVARTFDESKATTEDELKNDRKLQAAIQKFKEYLKYITTQKDPNTNLLMTKKNCIPQLWDYSSKFYTDEKNETYGAFDSPKNRLFDIQILGNIDLRLPVWAMQVIDCGLNTARNDHVPRNDVSSYYDVSSSKSVTDLRLGVNSYLTIYGAPPRPRVACQCLAKYAARARSGSGAVFNRISTSKNIHYSARPI